MNSTSPDLIHKQRLIFAWNYREWGGAQVYTLALIKAAKDEFDIWLVLPEGSDRQLLTFFERLGVKFRFFGPAAGILPADGIRQKVRRRWKKIRSENAMVRAIQGVAETDSIIHIDLSPLQSFRTLFRLCLTNTVFVTAHNSATKQPLYREILWVIYLRSIIKFRSFHIFCANQDAKDHITSYLSSGWNDRIWLIRAAIDPDKMDNIYNSPTDRSERLRSLGLPTDKCLILTVGQFIDRKGRWILMDAARNVLANNPNVVFVWIMPHLPSASDLDRIMTYKLLTGFVPLLSSDIGPDRESFLSFVACADLFVLPSLLEGLPIALLEAMALGVPVISSKINAIPEAVIDRQTGLLIEPENVNELADAILELAAEPEKRRQLAEAGRHFIQDHFDERESAQAAVDAYKDAARRAGAA